MQRNKSGGSSQCRILIESDALNQPCIVVDGGPRKPGETWQTMVLAIGQKGDRGMMQLKRGNGEWWGRKRPALTGSGKVEPINCLGGGWQQEVVETCTFFHASRVPTAQDWTSVVCWHEGLSEKNDRRKQEVGALKHVRSFFYPSLCMTNKLDNLKFLTRPPTF